MIPLIYVIGGIQDYTTTLVSFYDNYDKREYYTLVVKVGGVALHNVMCSCHTNSQSCTHYESFFLSIILYAMCAKDTQ